MSLMDRDVDIQSPSWTGTLNFNVLPWTDFETQSPCMVWTCTIHVHAWVGRVLFTSTMVRDFEFQSPLLDSFEEFGGNDVNYNRLFETDTCFASRDEAFEWAQKIAFDNGFALIKASNGAKNRKQPELLGSYFRCSRYGRTRKKIDPDIPEKPKKKGTPKCECLFRVRAVQNRANDINGKELIVWNILTSEKGGYHNHEVTKYKDGHRHFAGLNAEEKEFVRQQVRASIPPKDIKNGLHQRTPDKPQPTSTQIYSAVNKFRREVRGTRNTARQMLAVAVASNYVEWHKTDPETEELTHVFMAHPEAVKLFRAYPHVVLIDSTYKTNKYKIALVEVVGVTPCGSSFLIATVLLPSESEDDYGWMLLRLGELLSCTGSSISAFVTDREMGLIGALESLHPSTPHLLCRWHINRAMEKQALSKPNLMCYKDMILHDQKRLVPRDQCIHH
ncbi:protein FAR1-RELATED SEQUENCE 4-like [Silene latifolia]|uniref:protein FAR1-RELATED SEQUENCE 4-like n=1 Tax=Silene latifolia TaxID=37657 RepID=UPI003D76F7E4